MTATTEQQPETQPVRKWHRRLRAWASANLAHQPSGPTTSWQRDPVVAVVQAGVSITLAPVPLGVHVTMRHGAAPGAVLRRISELELANPSQLAGILDDMRAELPT